MVRQREVHEAPAANGNIVPGSKQGLQRSHQQLRHMLRRRRRSSVLSSLWRRKAASVNVRASEHQRRIQDTARTSWAITKATFVVASTCEPAA